MRPNSDQRFEKPNEYLGRTNEVNSSVYGEFETLGDAWVVINGGTKLHKKVARVKPSRIANGNSVNSDNSGTVGSESTSAPIPRKSNG